jgi:hypothetical protein
MPEAKHELHRPARKSCDTSTCYDDYAQAEPETKKENTTFEARTTKRWTRHGAPLTPNA